MKTTKDIAFECYKKAMGDKAQFIRLLEAHGYREGFNGYEAFGNCVRLYVGAPDRYIGFGFKDRQ